MPEPCKWDVQMGKIIEFMESYKGTKALMFSVVVAVIIQIGTFLFMWGGLTTTVKAHDTTIKTLCGKFDNVQIIGYAHADQVKK